MEGAGSSRGRKKRLESASAASLLVGLAGSSDDAERGKNAGPKTKTWISGIPPLPLLAQSLDLSIVQVLN